MESYDNISYLDDMITLVTNDKAKIIHCKSFLLARFNLLADLDQADEVHLNLSRSQLKKILLFTDILLCPTTKKGWIDLLTAADYLGLVSRYRVILERSLRKFLLNEDINIYASTLTLIDYIKKLENPGYLTIDENNYLFRELTKNPRIKDFNLN